MIHEYTDPVLFLHFVAAFLAFAVTVTIVREVWGRFHRNGGEEKMGYLYDLTVALRAATRGEKVLSPDDLRNAADVIESLSEGRRSGDMISRTAAVMALREELTEWNDDHNLRVKRCIEIIEGMPGIGGSVE